MSTWRSHIGAHPHNCSLTLSLLELQVVPAEEESRRRERRKRRQVMGLKPLHPRHCCWLTSGGHPDDAVWVMYV